MQVHLCLKVLINLASTPTNLPAFNSTYSQSDIIVLVLPLTNGQHSNLALCSKLLLALLNPLLDCDQLYALKLIREEAKMLIPRLSEAILDPHHVSQECTLLTLLRAVVWFVHEYHRTDKTLDMKSCSEYEKTMIDVSQELESNACLLVEEGLLPVLKSALKLFNEEEIQVTATRLVWCLTHNKSIRAKILDDTEIVHILKDKQNALSPKLNMASFCSLWHLGVQTNGTCTKNVDYS